MKQNLTKHLFTLAQILLTNAPLGHAAFGYVLYSLYTRLHLNHPPQGLAALALAFGTQFPDLIDKPLTWTFAVLPYGRSFAHSLFTLVPLLAILWLVFDTEETHPHDGVRNWIRLPPPRRQHRTPPQGRLQHP